MQYQAEKLDGASSLPKMVDGQQRAIGEYLVSSDYQLNRHEIQRLLKSCAVRDFWETNVGSYLVRVIPDPGFAVVNHEALASHKVRRVERNR